MAIDIPVCPFYLIDTPVWSNLCGDKILSVIIAPLENTRKPKRGLNGHPQRPRRTVNNSQADDFSNNAKPNPV